MNGDETNIRSLFLQQFLSFSRLHAFLVTYYLYNCKEIDWICNISEGLSSADTELLEHIEDKNSI